MTHNVSKTLEKPLLGAVLCCTSITPEDRIRLAEYAEQMGAEHKLDLTSDVTHLLVGSTDTPKYQYVAREREDVKVLRPEWVEAVRECWMEDRPLDMNALEAEYRVPTLAGLKICITGFHDLTFRAQLQKNIMLNGGDYTGDLTKDVTHVIAAAPEGKKYEYATLWQKKIVSLQWYKDTLDRGMQLEESSYHPSVPAEQQGVGAWIRQEKGRPKLGKRSNDEQPVVEPTRKLRRTASAKLSSQTDNMWGEIVGQPSDQPDSDRDFLRPSKSASDLRGEQQRSTRGQQNRQHDDVPSNEGGFLRGSIFAIWKFESRKEALISRTLQAVGAVVVDDLADLSSNDEAGADNKYLIVPHQTTENELPSFRLLAQKPTTVTELWLERCMLQKSLITLDQYPLGGIIARIQASEINTFTVNATGFQSIETLHIAKTVALTGAKYAEVFTPQSSVLVCNSMNINKQKMFHAKQWKIPAVSESWLCRFLTDGVIPNTKHYLIDNKEDEDDIEAELKQKRLQRRPPQPPDDNQGGYSAIGKRSATSALQRSESAASAGETSNKKQETEMTKQGSQQSSQNRQHSSRSSFVEDTALREISPNSPSRRNRPSTSPKKKSLFRTFDGADGMTENRLKEAEVHAQKPDDVSKPSPSPSVVQDAALINSTIQDLLNMKAKAKANAPNQQSHQKDKKKRLLSRALSNLSNASHGSRQSRASSIDSLNTDGLGSEIAPPSGKSVSAEGTAVGVRHNSLQGRAQNKPSSTAQSGSLYQTAPIDPFDPHLLRDEEAVVEEVPQMTQLGYEDSEEAMALREKLAAKRRARSKLGQHEGDAKPEISGKEREALKQRQKQKQVIKDDETLNATGWGGGRRTRAKNRSTDISDLDMF